MVNKEFEYTSAVKPSTTNSSFIPSPFGVKIFGKINSQEKPTLTVCIMSQAEY